MTAPQTYDSPWKEALTLVLRAFMELCFPDAARQIDWSRPIEFLDKELQKIAPEASQGRQYVDKLVKVYLLSGVERIIFLHLEVQHHRDDDFCKRMFNYFIRLSLKFDHNVASFAILADENPKWHPSEFQTDLLGCNCKFEFPICKLLDLTKDQQKLEQSNSPAALIILANRASQLTAHNHEERYRLRKELTISLYGKGLSSEETMALLYFYDWLLPLPAAKSIELDEELKTNQKEKHMPHVMEIEKRAIERTQRETQQTTLQQSILRALNSRFKQVSPEINFKVTEVSDLERLQTGLDLAYTSPDLPAFERLF